MVAFADLRPGDKIAVLLPDKRNLAKIFCESVGDTGHVYVIAVPVSSAAEDSQAKPTEESAGGACTNVTALTLQPKNFPAPELYNSSDDPGSVYAYVTQRLPIESFVAPEPLDLIWVATDYRDLRGAKFGSPNMAWVNEGFLRALKSGAVLIVEDQIAGDRVKAEMIVAGFEFIASFKANNPDRLLFKFRKPL